MKNKIIQLATVALACVALVAQASAATIISPVDISGTTYSTGGGSLGNTINQTGLSGGFTSGVTDFAAYIGSSPTHTQPTGTTGWASLIAGGPLGTIDYDLGGTFAVSQFALWGSNLNRSINGFTLFAANNSDFIGATNLGSFNASIASDPMAAEVFSFLTTSAQFIRIQVDSNHGAPNIIIGEVAFDAEAVVSDVPEPGTLLLFGAGLLGLAVRRRR